METLGLRYKTTDEKWPIYLAEGKVFDKLLTFFEPEWSSIGEKGAAERRIAASGPAPFCSGAVSAATVVLKMTFVGADCFKSLFYL